MCGSEHGHRHHEHRGFGPGFGRGFGRRGFPPREELVERLERYRRRLQDELANVDDVLRRLQDEQPGAGTQTTSV